MKWYCLWVHIIMSLVQYHAGFCQHLVGNNSIQNHHLCREEESLWLLQLKQSLFPPQEQNLHFFCPRPRNYFKMMSWNRRRRDCCLWDGVTCDRSTGHVVGLDLSCSALEATIGSNSTLFRLTHLRSLNLAYNYLETESFKFGELTSLTHLYLSSLEYSGDIPVEFYHLSNLAWLDIYGVSYKQNLSYSSSRNIKLDIKTLLGNMTKLRLVSLGGVNISSELPVNISSSSLKYLDLDFTGLRGNLPASIFEIPALQILALEYNADLTGSLPSFNKSSVGLMEELNLSGTSISGRLPDSIGFMTNLKSINFVSCKFSGPIPDSIGNLTQITKIDLSGNELSSKVPSTISNLRQLTFLLLLENHLQGQLPDAFSHLQRLEWLLLGGNRFTGVIPSSLTNISQLWYLDIASNNLTGPLPSKAGLGLQKLSQIVLSDNSIQGTLPSWILTLPSLTNLDLSSNKLTGEIDKFNSQSLDRIDLSSNQLSIQLESFNNLTSLYTLSLSHNTIIERGHRAANSTLPNLITLFLSACEIKEFPHLLLANLSSLGYLDLSNNEIHGPIPSWFSTLSWAKNLIHLNLSMNYLTHATNLPWQQLHSLEYLDLHSNSLQDTIPSFIYNLTSLIILDLSTNKLRGTIPVCIGNSMGNLQVIDLRKNELQGRIPSTIGAGMSNLVNLGLNENQLEGPLPPSLANCTQLEVIDVGNNMIQDTFPWWLGNLTSLKVLILKSNNFHGSIHATPFSNNSFSYLQIIDLSNNNFTGMLPDELFAKLQAMKKHDDEDSASDLYMGTVLNMYHYSMTLSVKGVDMEFTRVLRIFTTIDLSSNNFNGSVPESITDLSILRLLNISHNNISGSIPKALGRMTKLEQLDLSSNQLTGGIPQTLTNLTFLAVLNLSHNHLFGPIPKGNQFETFTNDSYIGNSGLCGDPLTRSCENDREAPSIGVSEEDDEDSGFMAGFTWKVVVIGYGCGVVMGFIMGYVMVSTQKRKWLARFVYVEAAIILERRKKKRTRAPLQGPPPVKKGTGCLLYLLRNIEESSIGCG